MPLPSRIPPGAFASLPMYDLEPVARDLDAWWLGLARILKLEKKIPRLTRGAEPVSAWQSPLLLLGETCGLPLVAGRAGGAQVVAVPCRKAARSEGYRLSSVLVARRRDVRRDVRDSERQAVRHLLDQGRPVINYPDSLSGCLVLAAVLEAELGSLRGARKLKEAIVSGGHLESLASLRTGGGDYASIDGATLELIKTHAPNTLNGLAAFAYGPLLPGLPLIVSSELALVWKKPLQAALAESKDHPRIKPHLDALGITDFFFPDGNASELYAPVAKMALHFADSLARLAIRIVPQAPELPFDVEDDVEDDGERD